MPAGFYIDATAGLVVPNDNDLSYLGHTATFDYDRGASIGGQVGYRFGNGFRLEGDVSYLQSGYDSVSAVGVTVPLSGDVEFWSFTAGAYYDINTGTFFRPYVGAGIGAAHMKGNSLSATIAGNTYRANTDSETDLTAFGEVGAGLQVSDRVELVPSYRYQWVDNGRDGFDDTTTHIFRIGLRYSL